MLEFLTGVDPRAKREYIGSRLAQTVSGGGNAVLIVPEQENFERDKELMLRYGEQISNRINVTSFSRFCRAFLEENLKEVKPRADETAVNVLMSLAVKQLGDALEIYGKHYRRPGRVRELVSLYNAVANAGKTPEDLLLAGQKTTGGLKNKTQELSLIFTAFEALLTKRFSTETDNINVTAAMLPQTDSFLQTDFWFDDFRGFTGAQLQLMAALLPRCRGMYVSLTGYSEGDGRVSFPHVQKTRRMLTEAAQRAGIPVHVTEIKSLEKSAGLSHLRQNLFAPLPEEFEAAPADIRVMRAANRYEECELIAIEARALLDGGVCRARDIAVLHRDDGLNAPLLAALKKYGVPVFEDERRPLFAYPLVRLILAAAEIAAKGFATETVLAAAKTGVAGVTVEQTSELQNYVYRWQLDGRAWESDFTANPRGFGEKQDEDSAAELERINAVRRKLVQPIERLRTALRRENAQGACRAVYLYLKEIGAAEEFRKYAEYLAARGEESRAVECAGVWDACMEYLNALAGALGENTVTPQYFSELLTLILSGGSVGYIPPGVDKMTVGSVDRTRILAPKAVFIPGFSEGAFPKNTVTGGLFSSKELRALSAADLPLDRLPEEIYEEERLILYNALNLPELRLYLSYPAALTTGEKKEASPVLAELKSLFPALESGDLSAVPPLERVRTPASAFAQYAAAMQQESTFTASLETLLREDPEFAPRLSSLFRAVRGNQTEFSDPAEAVRLFGSSIGMSASKAETYAKCPFKYFCRYGMGVEKLTAARMDPRINGLIIHKAMEDILSAHLGEDLSDLSDDDLRAEAEASVDRYCAEYMGGTENLPPSVLRTLDRLKREITDILRVRRDEFNTCLFRTAATELSIGYDKGIKGYEVPLPDGGRLVIHGSVDRVDLMTDRGVNYVRVIDYKTGGKDFKLSDVFYGLNMQMLIYLFAICENGKDLFGETTPAGILYVPAKSAGQTLERGATEEDIMRCRLENGRMNGVILENADVIRGMETAARGIFINAMIKEDGTLKGRFLTLEQFRLLHKTIDEVLCGIGMDIHRGKIPALPVDEGGRTACDYCDYGAVCLRESSGPRRTVEKTDHDAAVKKLYGEAEQ